MPRHVLRDMGSHKKALRPEPAPKLLPQRSRARRCLCISPQLFLCRVKERGEGAAGQKPQRGSSFQTLLTNFPALRERERMTDHRTFRLIARQSEMVVFGTRRQHIPSISAAECCCRELIPPSPRQAGSSFPLHYFAM